LSQLPGCRCVPGGDRPPASSPPAHGRGPAARALVGRRDRKDAQMTAVRDEDRAWMSRALELARRGLFSTPPNPAVGCVLVRNGEIVGQGWHARAGEPHAEIVALGAAGARARGADVYVTLEPCSHHGRTGPCVDALVEARVHRVVAAMSDPDPRVDGAGFARLESVGIQTAT